jgi:hypothetical protein
MNLERTHGDRFQDEEMRFANSQQMGSYSEVGMSGDALTWPFLASTEVPRKKPN